MKNKSITIIEVVVVLSIIILLTSFSILAIKTIKSSYDVASISVVNSILNLGRSIARREGNYAGIYFYDHNDAIYVMEVIRVYDSNVPHLRLERLDGSDIKKISDANDINEAVILFGQNGRLAIKDVEINTYRSWSEKILTINGKKYHINSYTGQIIVP